MNDTPKLIHALDNWTACTSKVMEPGGRWSNDGNTAFIDKVTCPECRSVTVLTLTYPKTGDEDRRNKAGAKYKLPYDMFCFGNPMYADCHMAGSCRRRNRSCSE